MNPHRAVIPMPRPRSANPTVSRRAFTLIEMLVTIALIATVLSIVMPSVARIIRSSNYSAAVNAVTATLGRARSAAMQSGRPTAVAFLFDIKARKYTMLVLELAPGGEAGTIEMGPPQRSEPDCASDLTPNGVSTSIAAYSPLRFSQPVELPASTAVFGLSTLIPEIDIDGRDPPIFDQNTDGEVDPIGRAGSRDRDLQRWYAGEIINDGDNNERNNVLPWIFPRSDPRLDVDEGVDPWRILSQEQNGISEDEARAVVRHAQSFAIAFRPDGTVSANFGTGLGSSPREAYIEWPEAPIDQTGAANRPYDHADRFDPACLHPTDQRETQPNPEVRLRTVAELAVVDLKALQAGAGVSQPWLVRPASSLAPRPSSNDPKTRFLDDTLVLRMSDWIDANAEILGFNRYTGDTVKR